MLTSDILFGPERGGAWILGYLFLLLIAALLVAFSPVLLKLVPDYMTFRKSNYKNESGKGFLDTVIDKGSYGEFLTFAYVEKLELFHKILTNVYVKRKDGSTTEVDLVMICEKGIFVFESKNYSGWIFGDENHKMWTQTFQNRTKNRFLNPVWQNRSHVKAVQEALQLSDLQLVHSYIIFSERCSLKKVTVHSPNVVVIKRDMLKKVLGQELERLPNSISREDVNRYYIALISSTKVREEVKITHIESIREKRRLSKK